jgi:hypothetical protein
MEQTMASVRGRMLSWATSVATDPRRRPGRLRRSNPPLPLGIFKRVALQRT